MQLEFRTRFDCSTRRIHIIVKHLETGLTGESEGGEDEKEMKMQALISLVYVMARKIEALESK